MTRRASRPSGSRARVRPIAGDEKPLQHLSHLLASRGSDQAESALDRWVDALAESPEVFRASAEFLANATTSGSTGLTGATDTRSSTGENAAKQGFSRDERWLLLSIAAEIADDPILSDCCEELERRMEHEAQQWQGDSTDHATDDAPLQQDSPLYRALSDAWSGVRMAIEVSFLRDIGMTEMTRAMIEDANAWERALRDGEATLLGVPRIVLAADDDPFGILLP